MQQDEKQPAPVSEDPAYEDVVEVKEGQASPSESRTTAMELVWSCTNCGFLLPRSSQPPEVCPSCGAAREEFVAVTED